MERYMSKNSKKQIEADEKKVIRELEKHSSKNISQIAKNCGFSRQKVWRIIKRLERNKTIWGYHAVIDNNKVGLNRYFILVKRSNKPFSKEHMESIIKREINPKTEKLGIIIDGTSYLHGSFDGIFEIRADDIKNVKKFCEAVYNSSKGFISDMKILEELFPIEKDGIANPNIEELKDIFLTE
jgi:DNA-binding Lrp family transcriptional regulator